MILIGTHQNGVRTTFEGTIQKVRRFAKVNDLRHWAVYHPFVKGRPFHNATDPAFLVEHNNSPYWLNIEAKTGVHLYIICKDFDKNKVICSWKGDFEELGKSLPGFYFHVLRIEPGCVYLAAVKQRR